jgi:2-amino-4-hydroxy-6-hydroxymethyldihydropteridine diphosphokinase
VPRPVIAYIAFGSNLDNPERQLRAALRAVDNLPGTRLLRASSFYRSAPVGYTEQPDFVNAVAAIETTLAPRALLDALLGLEREQGRVRELPNGPRTLDLDIALYGDERVDEAGLTIPHPRLHERAFVVVPLLEIAPDAVVPGRGALRTLAAGIDEQSVARLTDPR